MGMEEEERLFLNFFLPSRGLAIALKCCPEHFCAQLVCVFQSVSEDDFEN